MRDKPWPGLRQDTTDLGEESWGQLHNVMLRIQGELRDRPALGLRHALPADVLGFLESSTTRRLIGMRGGVIRSVDADTPGAAFTIKSGLSSTVGCFSQCNGQMYYCNGSDAVQVISDGATVSQAAGIVAPASAPTTGTPAAGSITAGIHLIRYRYKNSVTGYFSNPSPAVSFTAAGSQNCPLTLVASTDAKVDKIVVEMTQAAGNVFYVVATTTNTTSYTISMDDTTLGVQVLADVYAASDGYGHEPPLSTFKVMCEHRNRLFALDALGYLYWSRASFPEAWKAAEWAKQVFTNRGDKPVALCSFFGDLYIIGNRGMARMAYTGDPAAGMMVQIPAALGVYNQRCVVDVEGAIYGFGRDGVWRITAMQPELISPPVQTTLGTVDDTYAAASCHAFFDPDERVVWCMFRATGDTGVRTAVCFDLNTQQWCTRGFRHSVVASGVFGSSTRSSYAYVADNDGGYTWRMAYNQFDGVPTTMANGVVTVQVGSTASVLNVAETLDTVTGLGGVILYDPVTDEERLIASNTANTITLGTPFSTTPATYRELYAGSIEQIVESGWVPIHYAFVGRRPDLLKIEHLSVSTSLGVDYKIEYFQDYSDTPITFTSVADDAPTIGLTLVNGLTYIIQNMDHGMSHCPITGDFNVVMKWRLTRLKPEGRARLLDCSMEMRDQKKAQDIPH